MAQLRELAKDYAPASVAATAALTDGKGLALVAADFDRTIRVRNRVPTLSARLLMAVNAADTLRLTWSCD